MQMMAAGGTHMHVDQYWLLRVGKHAGRELQ